MTVATNGFPITQSPLGQAPTMASITEIPQGVTPAAAPNTYPELDPSQLDRLLKAAPEVPNERVQEILTARSTAAQADAEAATYEKRRKDIDDQVNGFWPTAIAVAAMASGQFGPMWQLQEQKRQTKIAALTAPTVTQAIKLSQTGKIAEAEAMMSKLIADVGDKAPEFVKAIAPIQQQMNRDNLSLRDMKADLAKLDMEDLKEGTSMWNFRENLRHNVKFNIPISRENYAAMRQSSLPHTQAFEHGTVSMSPTTGQIESRQAMPAIVSPSTMQEDAMRLWAANLKERPEVLTDALNNLRVGKSATMTDGHIVQPGSQEATALNQGFVKASEQQAQMNISKNIQTEAIVASILKGRGYSAQQMSLPPGSPGGVPVQAWDAARKEAEATQKRVALAVPQWQAYEDPWAGMKVGGRVPVKMTGDIDELYGQTNWPVSLDEARKQGIGFMKESDQVIATDYLQAIKGLRQTDQLWKSLGNPKSWGELAGTAMERYASDWLGIPVTKGQGLDKAYEVFVDRAIERVAVNMERQAGQATPDVRAIRQLKELVIGKFTTPEAARAIVAEVEKRMMDTVRRIGGSYITFPEGTQQGTQQGTPASSMRQGGRYQPGPNSTFTPKGGQPITGSTPTDQQQQTTPAPPVAVPVPGPRVKGRVPKVYQMD